jgi:hypothetical protein
MSVKTDWYPGMRTLVLAMGSKWIEALALFATKWGVPAVQINDPTTGLIALHGGELNPKRLPLYCSNHYPFFKILLDKGVNAQNM